MGHAYTPGLTVTASTVLRRRRRLPLPGEVLVKMGDVVDGDQVIARTHLPGPVRPINVVNLLSIEPSDLPRYMLKQAGDAVAADEPIAETKPFLKFLKATVKSPVTGTIESISTVTGQVMIRLPNRPIELKSYLAGKIVEVEPTTGAVVEATGALIQGIFGVGQETWGELKIAVSSNADEFTADRLSFKDKGKILVVGSRLTQAIYLKAKELQVAGLVGGGISDGDLRQILGHDLGVAITGTENLGITLLTTEGFGPLPIAERTFSLLKSLAGLTVAMNGATQIRAGVVRPEIVAPRPAAAVGKPTAANTAGMKIGGPVRIIREPYFGAIGKIEQLPDKPEVMPSETKVRVARIRLTTGDLITVPRSNVEAIEQ